MIYDNRQNKMVHLVYTRFNLALKFEGLRGDSDIPKVSPWLNEDYLEQRFKIFEKYTFDSFSRQSNKNFTWFVMFHKDTPEKYKERIKIYQKKLQQFCPWYFDDEESASLTQIIKKDIQNHYEVMKGKINVISNFIDLL